MTTLTRKLLWKQFTAENVDMFTYTICSACSKPSDSACLPNWNGLKKLLFAHASQDSEKYSI